MKKILSLVLLAGLLAGHFVWIKGHVVNAIASPDADGYYAQAQYIANHNRVTFRAESPVQYVGLHWLEIPEDLAVLDYWEHQADKKVIEDKIKDLEFEASEVVRLAKARVEQREAAERQTARLERARRGETKTWESEASKAAAPKSGEARADEASSDGAQSGPADAVATKDKPEDDEIKRAQDESERLERKAAALAKDSPKWEGEIPSDKGSGRFISRYPPGLPTMLAGAWKLGGREAVAYVDPALRTLTLLFLFLFCMQWSSPLLALLATAAFAAHPLANQHAIYGYAHNATMFLLVAGLYFLSAWARNPLWWKAVLAGGLLGILPSVRPAEGAAALGIGVFVVWQLIERPQYWKQLGLCVLAAMVPAGLFAWHNWVLLGHPLRTAYVLTGEQQSITWANVERLWSTYLDVALGWEGMGLFFALGLAGAFAMLFARESRAIATCLLLVLGGITLAYMGYYWTIGGRADIRFLLPTVPLYFVGATWLLHRAQAPRHAGVVAACLLCGVIVVRGLYESPQRLEGQQLSAQGSKTAIDWLDALVPDGSIIIGDRRAHEQLHYTGKWRLADASVLNGRGGFGMFGRGRTRRGTARRGDSSTTNATTNPSPMQRGKARGLRSKYDKLERGVREQIAMEDLIEWGAKDKREVYWLGTRREVERFEDTVAGAILFEKVDEFKTPAAPPRERTRPQRGRRGFGGRGNMRGRFGRAIGNMFGLRAGQQLEVFKVKSD